jgi:hypothetical protein
VCWYVRLLPFWLQLQILTTLLIILACDYQNLKCEYWTPILAILCDGEKFEFLVYDSVLKSVYSSQIATGVLDLPDMPEHLAPSLKRGKVTNNLYLIFNTNSFLLATEYIFDYFLMGYINGLRSFGRKSELAAKRSRTKKRESTGKWMDALARAERAHWLCRKAAELARERKVEEAEECATKGIDELKERSVSTQFS